MPSYIFFTFFPRNFRYLNNVFPQNLKIPPRALSRSLLSRFAVLYININDIPGGKFNVSFSYFSKRQPGRLMFFSLDISQYFVTAIYYYIPFYYIQQPMMIIYIYPKNRYCGVYKSRMKHCTHYYNITTTNYLYAPYYYILL